MSNAQDSILEYFVHAANKHDFSLNITLNVGGAMVTGTMISAKEYFSLLSEKFEGGNDISNHLSEQLKQAGESAKGDEETPASFIHLNEAQVYCGDREPTPSEGEVLWRGKLSEVDGFFLGKISAGETTSDQEKDGHDSSSNKLNNRLDQLEENIKGLFGKENDDKDQEKKESEEEPEEDERIEEEEQKEEQEQEQEQESTDPSSEEGETDEESGEEKEAEEETEEKEEEKEKEKEKEEDLEEEPEQEQEKEKEEKKSDQSKNSSRSKRSSNTKKTSKSSKKEE
ncbi:gas vesicle protein U [Alkalihalophilus pseudofirmus OF4]|uniref:Gas vesicle protein U n=1 Tax=Alkalihalophilus pseudofirmus (strain ATCC BAA-2126 / JCM 17055 / OF4) TaxID=398511 RepID=D3FQB1_ALKPO|nr:gas vesicle accessory protein GvpU [Alkalihalophilus pseudofirmus]ADC49583.1 gas vesicle protein U [Alkalihalophilus pseudofirmus OF4]